MSYHQVHSNIQVLNEHLQGIGHYPRYLRQLQNKQKPLPLMALDIMEGGDIRNT